MDVSVRVRFELPKQSIMELKIKKTMTPLSTYVDNLLNEMDIMSYHFKLEFDLSYNNGYKFLTEKHGIYDGLMEFIVAISQQLADDIKNNDGVKYELSKDQLIDEEGKEFFQNIFFKKIIIDASVSNLDTSYRPNKSHYVEKDKLLDVVYITVNTAEDDTYEKLVRSLAHELTHAYENYKRLLGKKDSLKELISTDTRYNKAIKFANDGSYEDFVKRTQYTLTSFERNAFLTEIRASLEGKKIRTYKDAIEEFKKTDVYTQYALLHEMIKSDAIDWEDFCDTYNEEFDTNYTVTKIKKWLTNSIEKAYQKMMKLIPKVYFDYYEEQRKNEIKEGNIMPLLYMGSIRLERWNNPLR